MFFAMLTFQCCVKISPNADSGGDGKVSSWKGCDNVRQINNNGTGQEDSYTIKANKVTIVRKLNFHVNMMIDFRACVGD